MNHTKNIWIVNEYAGSPTHGMEFRHYYLAKNFIKLGYNVTIISATFSHLFNKFPKEDEQFNQEIIDGIEYVWIKVPKYKSSKDKWRVIKWFIFCFKLFFVPLKIKNKPSIILMSCAAPFAIFPSIYLKWKFKAKLVFEVKDVWPLSIVSIGNFSKNHPFIRFMSYAEKVAINSCDFLVSNLPNYKEHVESLKIDKDVYYAPNGIEIATENTANISESLRKLIPEDKFIVGYTGTVGQANALDYFVESARLLKDNNKIHFVIVGNGSEKENLKEYCIKNELSNIVFINAISKNEIQSMLQCFDVCFIGWNNDPLYKFGIAANKIFDYMLSGKPILHSYSGEGDLIKMANCGISVPAMNPEEIAKGILELSALTKDELAILGQNGKTFVKKNHTYENIAKNYLEHLKN